MSTLIVYGSRTGYAEECAERIREKLGDEEFVIFTHIDSQELPVVSDYDRIIIGGSVRFGRIQRKLKRFMDQYRSLLLQREIGIFLCCLSQGKDAEKLMHRHFPEELISHAKALCFPGGLASLDKVHPAFRRFFSSKHRCLDTRSNKALDAFVKTLLDVRKTAPVS